MIRLAQAMAGAHHGGAETFFVRLALALHRAGQEQRVIIRRDAERAAALRTGGLAPMELPFGGLLDYRTRFGIRRILREFRPRVVLTWMSRATRLCPHGEFVHVGRLGGYYDLKYYRRCDHLIGNTRDIVAYLVRSGWPEGRAHYLPNFVPDMTGVRIARASLGTPEDVPLVLALGRLHPNKGFDVLIDAVARAPGIHLWLAGEGLARAELETRAERLALGNRVRFLGWREDTAALLATADMLVCPSRHEPLGNVVIEAWAAGVPVVAASSAGPAALIRDGINGLLVPVEDADGLARAMTRLAETRTLRAELAAAGRSTYGAEFSESVVVAQYRAFLEHVAR
ncbi:MAG TPA: glycosyltransferase [Stellaceae bacterium]|nr:glycosyltransferase [Stellaceae bacterium]